jgi:hypothetical protein
MTLCFVAILAVIVGERLSTVNYSFDLVIVLPQAFAHEVNVIS